MYHPHKISFSVQEEKFNIIAQALSQEFLCFSYYERLLAEALGAPDCSAAFREEAQRLQLAAQKQKVSIREQFGTGSATLRNWEKVQFEVLPVMFKFAVFLK